MYILLPGYNICLGLSAIYSSPSAIRSEANDAVNSFPPPYLRALIRFIRLDNHLMNQNDFRNDKIAHKGSNTLSKIKSFLRVFVLNRPEINRVARFHHAARKVEGESTAPKRR